MVTGRYFDNDSVKITCSMYAVFDRMLYDVCVHLCTLHSVYTCVQYLCTLVYTGSSSVLRCLAASKVPARIPAMLT